MCYSAMVEQNFKSLGLKKGDVIDYNFFKELFRKRYHGENIYIPKAMEANFLGKIETPVEGEIKKLILDFKVAKISDEQSKLFGFKKRLADADRKLADKPTKGAQKEKEVCERQIERTKQRLENIESEKLREEDSRIFPLGWAPMIILKEGKRVVVPARYHLRPQGQSDAFDRKYDGNYNARIDRLEDVAWWKNIFGKNHGVFVIHKFYENVPRHLFEKRDLRPGEKEENMVLEFTPSDGRPMYVAVLFDVWPNTKQPDFYSAAAVTMNPPPEIAETGHQRCIVPIPEDLVEEWLTPGKPLSDYYAILEKHVTPYYKHKIAA